MVFSADYRVLIKYNYIILYTFVYYITIFSLGSIVDAEFRPRDGVFLCAYHEFSGAKALCMPYDMVNNHNPRPVVTGDHQIIVL